MMCHGMDRGIRQVAVEPVFVEGKTRDGADRVAHLEPLHARPDGGDGARRLVPEPGRQFGSFQVLAAAEHRLRPVQPQRLDADLDLALFRRRHLQFFDAQDFRAAGLMKSHDTCHVSLLQKVLEARTNQRYCNPRNYCGIGDLIKPYHSRNSTVADWPKLSSTCTRKTRG